MSHRLSYGQPGRHIEATSQRTVNSKQASNSNKTKDQLRLKRRKPIPTIKEHSLQNFPLPLQSGFTLQTKWLPLLAPTLEREGVMGNLFVHLSYFGPGD